MYDENGNEIPADQVPQDVLDAQAADSSSGGEEEGTNSGGFDQPVEGKQPVGETAPDEETTYDGTDAIIRRSDLDFDDRASFPEPGAASRSRRPISEERVGP